MLTAKYLLLPLFLAVSLLTDRSLAQTSAGPAPAPAPSASAPSPSPAPAPASSSLPPTATSRPPTSVPSGSAGGPPNPQEYFNWPCKAGYFCQSPDQVVKCPSGFYCPENTFQPSFCCGGYYCPTPAEIKPCPVGHVCQKGSAVTKVCYLGYCSPGSHTETKIAVFVVFVAFLVLIWTAFAIKNRFQTNKRSKYKARIQAIKNTPAFMRKGTKLVSSSRVFDISFENLGLTLPNGVNIMRNVTGELRSGRSCAVMGPSGAGKTTFISLLTGKARRTAGHVYVNGRPGRLEDHRKLIGFVPQEDVMIRELTVRDIITHSAMTRLPVEWSARRKKEKILQTIEYLGLAHVMDSIIGDEETRGVSGGQRKRVNIGMELVAEPSILFLDEPTSGLDSATSLERLTVAAIIHSPSPQAFARFDDLLLLGKGGQVIYHGPRNAAPEYFASRGFPVPPGVNEADFYLDVASGKVERQGYPGEFHPVELFDMWQAYRRSGGQGGTTNMGSGMVPFDGTGVQGKEAEAGMGHLPLPGGTNIALSDGGARMEEAVPAKESIGSHFIHWFHDVGEWTSDVFRELGQTITGFFTCCTRGKDPVRQTPGPLRQFALCFKRSLYQIYRSPGSFVADQMLHLGCGLFISIAAQKSVFLPPLPDQVCDTVPLAMQEACRQPQSDYLRQVGQFIAWGIGFAGIAVGSGTFGNERVVAWRERATGSALFPYFMAKSIADIPRAAIAAAMFLLSFILTFNSTQSTITLYLIVFALYFVGFSSGFLISAIVSRQKAALVGVVFALVWAIAFSGVQPAIRQIREEYGWLGWLFGISAPRWAISAFYIKESVRKGYEDTPNVGLSIYGYDSDDYGRDIAYCFIIGVMWQTLAFIFMKLLHREKQK
ncbi:MAG: hypothetical protein DHS80DRAFT_27237 [Piptocephalis tieghemiana]|nr:MAG: hypothetical protein DHS80DRAFT_27237 [Piptocephalis tieghemiana]